MKQQTQGPRRIRLSKVKQPSPNRNKQKMSMQTTTIYQTSSFDDDEQDSLTVSTKHWNTQKLTIAYKPQKIIGRQKQKSYINEFINGCLMKQITNRCLYISGCPGLGKTATVMQIIKQIQKTISVKKATFQYINCLELKQPAGIYKQLLMKSKHKLQSIKKQPHSLAIEFDKFLRHTKLQYFFVIDEVDFLYTKNQNVIYNLVEWCSQGECNFSVLMIANTMDFPEKLAPKITSRMGSWRMCFKPYSSDEIKKILQQRLQGSSLFQPKTIQFAVKKFAIYTSDLRKIFNILRQVTQSHQSNNKKITIQQLSTVWNRLVQDQDIGWKFQLPEIYTIVIDLIKKQGGKVHSYEIFKMLSQKKVKWGEVEMVVKDLKEMGIVKTLEKDWKGVKGLMVSLVDGSV